MELNELKDLWTKENKELENRIKLNEKTLRAMNMTKAVGAFDKLLNLSIAGRTMALVYCTISLVMSSMVMEELVFSIPGIIGGLAMLWSFVQHLAIDKPDYERVSLVELQKSIAKFKMHSSRYAKYDIGIVLLWIVTSTPLYLRVMYHVPVYSHTKSLVFFCLICLVAIVVTVAFSKKAYQEYDTKLTQSEKYLEQIAEFEEQ